MKTSGTIQARDLLAAADAADLAANAETRQQEYRAAMAIMQHKELLQIGLIQAKMQRCSQAPHAHERLPLCESGDVIGKVESRIPKELFFHMLHQKNFGWDGLTSDEGQRDLLKAFPVCRVKTISGKTVVPVGRSVGAGTASGAGRASKRGGVTFGRGTLTLAT